MPEAPERLEEGGMLLGAMPTFQSYGMGSVTMRKGDLMVMFTDGVTETMDREGLEDYGEDRLAATVTRLMDGEAQAGAVMEGILDDVRRFGSGVFSDDLTVLVLRKTD
jgi:serine phosphatase RsbU (regulator of sigma subunit)